MAKKTRSSARFVEILWSMVNNEDEIKKCGEYISWNESGTGIVIESRNELASHVLPTYFNTREFSSFHRQLTNYGFKKLQDVEWDEFVNENFIRGFPELRKNIIKKKPPDKHKKGSSARGESLKTHHPPQNSSTCTSLPHNAQVPAASEQLTAKRPQEQMTGLENELSNQKLKKLRASGVLSTDPDSSTLLRSLGTASAVERVLDQAYYSLQIEGELQELLFRNTEEISHANPDSKEARNDTVSHSFLEELVDNVPMGYPYNATSTMQLNADTDNTSMGGDFSKHDEFVPVPVPSDINSRSTLLLPDLSQQSPGVSAHFQTLTFEDLREIDGSEPVAPPPRLTTSSSSSSFESCPPTSSISVNAYKLQEEYQSQRDDIIQMPEPPQEKHAQVSHGMRGNNSDSGLGSQSSSSAPQSRHTSDIENSALEEYPIIKIRPNPVGLLGAPACEFLGLAELFPEVESGYATVGNLNENILWEKGDKHGNGNCIPSSPKAGKQIVKIYSSTGKKLAEAELCYVDDCQHTDDECLKRVGARASQSYEELCRVMNNILIRCTPQASIKSGKTQHSGNSESSLIVQVLRFLINEAAESGLQWDSLPLLQFVAMNHDDENATLFLEEITDRYATDITPGGRERTDLSELLAAINASHEEDEATDTSDGRNDSDSSYDGDVESLLCDSEEPTSDSEDDHSDMLRKAFATGNEIQMGGNNAETDERVILSLPSGYFSGAQIGEKEIQPTHSRLKDSTVSVKESVITERVSDQPFPTSSDSVLPFGKNGKFSRKAIAIKQREKDSKLLQGEYRISRIRKHFNCEFPNLTSMKSVRQPIICFLLTTESINRCLSTMEDRWRIQLQLQRLSGRMTTSPLSMLFQAMRIKPEEALKSLSTDAGLSTPSDNITRATCKPFDSPLASNDFTPSDVVALTSIYRPSGKILLSFVSDRNGFLPPESWFEDEDCELLMECWKWSRCKNNLLALKVVEIKDQPASSGIRAQGRLATGVYKRPLWEEKGLVKRESSYGSLKDNAYSKRLKEPLVVDNKKSESSQNMENLLSFAEKLPPTMKDRKKPQLMRGDVAELKTVIGEKVIQPMETDTHGKQDMYPVARGTTKVSSNDSQQIVWEHRVRQGRSRREAELSSEEFPTRIKENHLRTSPVATRTASVSTGDERKAIPLCLPSNCKWNSHARECTKTEEQRSSLYVVDETIEKLREVKGPVCVVPIAGPYRKGKSFILSELFDQPNVFPLGHEMVAETMGKYKKYKDWRARYKTTEDEEKALAIGLEQSLKECVESYSRLEHRVQQDRSRREAELSSEEFPTRIKENHLRPSPVATGTASVSTGDERKAIPLCLPNNCKWDSHARECTKTEEQRSSLYVVDEAIEKLREVKGPVCVVSIAGPYRKGKSYILSEAFDQPMVFPLRHEMVAETVGIWLWIVPEKYKDSRGQEFTVVLLDSEEIDAASSVGYYDNQIFTLTVLLASVLIYNSQGVPRRCDLEELDFIAKLSQRIQVRSNQGVGVKQKETELFHRTFPYFLWLLRDVTQVIPRDCKDLKDYFLKKSRPDTIENQYEGIIDSGRELALMFNILKDQTSTMNQDTLETLRPLQFILKSLQEIYHDSERNFALGNESLVAHRKWASSSDLVTDQEKNNITLTPVSQIRIMKSPRRNQNTSNESKPEANLVYNGSSPTPTPPDSLTVSRYDNSILSPISDVDPPSLSPRKRVSYRDDVHSSLRRRSYRRAIASDDNTDQNSLERDQSSSERPPTPPKKSDSQRRSRLEAPQIVTNVDADRAGETRVIYQGDKSSSNSLNRSADSTHKKQLRAVPDSRQRYGNGVVSPRRSPSGNNPSITTDQSRTSSLNRTSPPIPTSPKPSPYASTDSLRRSSGDKDAYSSSSSPRSSPRSSGTSGSATKFLNPGHVARSPSRTSSSSSGSEESWHSVASSVEGAGRRRVRKMPRTPSPTGTIWEIMPPRIGTGDLENGYDVLQPKTAAEYEQELSDLREELLETKRNLASTHEQLILQESSTHKLVASFKERLAESEKSLQKLREEKDKEMKELLDRLVSVESELRKEQKEMQEVIQAKQVIVEAQERRIKSADSSNAKLIATLNQIRSSRNNSKLLNYPSSDL